MERIVIYCEYFNNSLGLNKIGPDGVKILFDWLKNKKSVIFLDLSKNLISDKGVGIIAEMMKGDKTLQMLVLNNSDITDKGVIELASSLIGNTTLTHLDLWSNYEITDASYPVLKEMLQKSSITNKGWTYWLDVTSISDGNWHGLNALCRVPVAKRLIPINSLSKSASKSSKSTSSIIYDKCIEELI